MKQTAIALLVLLSSAMSQAQTKVTFDKFKNTTHFMTEETQASKVTLSGGKDASMLIHHMGMVIGFLCAEQVKKCEPAGVALLFVGHTSSWRMHGSNEVSLLIDGKPASAGKASWNGQVLKGDDLREYNEATVSPELLDKLAGAKTVDVQIGVFEFSLTDANLAAIRDIASHAGVSVTPVRPGVSP